MSTLVESLVFVCTILLVPVVAALFALATIRLLDLGGFAREWWERRCTRSDWTESARYFATDNSIHREETDKSLLEIAKALPTFVGDFVSRSERDHFNPLLVEKHANDCEIESLGRLASLSFSIRVGPMLGLMGTLIPLGPSLLSLSSGDVGTMSQQLAIAFGTTVLGLLIGGVAYGQWLVRRQWYARDSADIEFIRQCIASRNETAS